MKQYLWIVNLLFFSGYSFFTARSVNNIVEKQFFPLEITRRESNDLANNTRGTSTRRSREPYKVINYRNIFDSANALKEVPPDETPEPSEETGAEANLNTDLPLAKLKAKLVGVFLFSYEELSQAIFEVDADRQVLGIGASIEGATIVKVENDKVTLRREHGKLEVLLVDQKEDTANASSAEAPTTGSEDSAEETGSEGGIKRVDSNRFVISRERVDAAMADMNAILRQARAIPYNDPVTKKPAGFKIVAIRPGSIYRQLGVRNGDVIQRINGNELNSIEAAVNLFSTLKNEVAFSIDLLRMGKKKTFNYEIQ